MSNYVTTRSKSELQRRKSAKESLRSINVNMRYLSAFSGGEYSVMATVKTFANEDENCCSNRCKYRGFVGFFGGQKSFCLCPKHAKLYTSTESLTGPSYMDVVSELEKVTGHEFYAKHSEYGETMEKLNIERCLGGRQLHSRGETLVSDDGGKSIEDDATDQSSANSDEHDSEEDDENHEFHHENDGDNYTEDRSEHDISDSEKDSEVKEGNDKNSLSDGGENPKKRNKVEGVNPQNDKGDEEDEDINAGKRGGANGGNGDDKGNKERPGGRGQDNEDEKTEGGDSGCNNEMCSYPSCAGVSLKDATCFLCDNGYHIKCKKSYTDVKGEAPDEWDICFGCQPSHDEWVRELSKLHKCVRRYHVALKKRPFDVSARGIATKWNQGYNDLLQAIRALSTFIPCDHTPHFDPQEVESVEDMFRGVFDDLHDIATLVQLYNDNLPLDVVQNMFKVFGVTLQGIERAVPTLATQEQQQQQALSLLANASSTVTTETSHPAKVDASEAKATKKTKTEKKQKAEIVLNPPVYINCQCCGNELLAPFRPLQSEGKFLPFILFRSTTDVAGASKSWSGHNMTVFPKPMGNTTNLTRSSSYHPFGVYQGTRLVKVETTSLENIGSSLRIIPIRAIINLYMNKLDESVVGSAYSAFINGLKSLEKGSALTTTAIQTCFFNIFASNVAKDNVVHQKVSEAWTNNAEAKKKLEENPFKDKIQDVSIAWISKVENAVKKVFKVLKCEDTNTTVALGKSKEVDSEAIKDLLMTNLYLSLESELKKALTCHFDSDVDVHGQVLEGSSSAELKSYFEEKSKLLALIIHYHFHDVMEFVKTGLKMTVTDQAVTDQE